VRSRFVLGKTSTNMVRSVLERSRAFVHTRLPTEVIDVRER
jgi:hypothetical protein